MKAKILCFLIVGIKEGDEFTYLSKDELPFILDNIIKDIRDKSLDITFEKVILYSSEDLHVSELKTSIKENLREKGLTVDVKTKPIKPEDFETNKTEVTLPAFVEENALTLILAKKIPVEKEIANLFHDLSFAKEERLGGYELIIKEKY